VPLAVAAVGEVAPSSKKTKRRRGKGGKGEPLRTSGVHSTAKRAKMANAHQSVKMNLSQNTVLENIVDQYNGFSANELAMEVNTAVADESAPRRSGRDRKTSQTVLWAYNHLTADGVLSEHVTHTIARSAKDALNIADPLERKGAVDAIMDELNNLVETHHALVPYQSALVNYATSTILPSSLFIDKKYADGLFVKFKARLVAGGHRQVKADFAELSTYTVNTETVFMLLALSAKENRELATIDVAGAYLNADMSSPDGKDIYIKLGKELTALYVQARPDFVKYVSNDGSMLLKAEKAMYGCVQSSYLWQEMLKSKLLSMGFRISAYDQCLAIKRVKEGNIYVAFHVDDLLISASSKELRDDFLVKFGKIFDTKSHVGDELDYLGLHISRNRAANSVTLSQRAMIANIVDGIAGKSNVPMVVSDVIVIHPLIDEYRQKVFRSKVAQVLYVSKRTRPDVLFAVNQLCRKAYAPDEGDWNALTRLLKYLSTTRNKVLVLHCTELSIVADIDASFASGADRKSNTGAVIRLGSAILWAKASKQPIITKSSSEAELVALSDVASMVLWFKLIMADMGYDIEAPTILQDNQSTIHIATHGLTNKETTRHIDTRLLWMKEFILKKQLIVKYCKTDEMLADGLTKPLVGEAFQKMLTGMNVVESSHMTLMDFMRK
jgi:hypothetical protein